MSTTSVQRNETSPGSYERVQIINDQKEFTQELSSQIRDWGLHDAGFSYDIVAVFGSQSTGKSTLLNRLFGTNFDVMDESKRQQTTKGIWMCRSKGMNVMVMDVEGTDGRERGEDQDFERKSALFSLASSEILIINLWEHQIGLYQGANIGLLKTVFEVNLGLFGKRSQDGTNQRTLLLFVIRDHVGATPLENLKATLSADMNKLWDSISKPSELQDRQLSDYFDLTFTALPHKILVPDKFEAEVRDLRKRFVDKGRDDYFFKPAYHKRIPADGVAFYMEGIWEQVQTNKDLDLPTQQELLAQFRCDEISTAAFSDFNEQAKSQRKPIEGGRVVSGLGGLMMGWWSQALVRYDRDASRYHQGVYKRKRADLLALMESTLSPLYLGQLKNIHKSYLLSFKQDMLDQMQGDKYDFADIVNNARAKYEKLFLGAAQEALLDGTHWSYDEELISFQDEIGNVANQCRKDETKKMVNVIERNFKRQITEHVEFALSKPTPDMWDTVLRFFRQILDRSEASYLTKAKKFDCTDEENATSLATLRRRAWLVLRGKVDEQTADAAILGKLRAYFEERFRYDDQGLPRVWRPQDDIDGAYSKAKDQTLELIPIYSRISPLDPSLEYSLPSETADASLGTDDFDFPSTLIIYSGTKALELANRFRRDADAYYVEAKRSMVSSIAQIPYWMYGVLVVLGWNEAMAIIFNPFYFAMVTCLAASAWIILQLGLAGPLIQITQKVGSEVYHQGHERLKQHFTQAMMEPAEIVNGTRSASEALDSNDPLVSRVKRESS